jgi:regulator of protease activity HflC (stomatin/prohibitin superfamily)
MELLIFIAFCVVCGVVYYSLEDRANAKVAIAEKESEARIAEADAEKLKTELELARINKQSSEEDS